MSTPGPMTLEHFQAAVELTQAQLRACGSAPDAAHAAAGSARSLVPAYLRPEGDETAWGAPRADAHLMENRLRIADALDMLRLLIERPGPARRRLVRDGAVTAAPILVLLATLYVERAEPEILFEFRAADLCRARLAVDLGRQAAGSGAKGAGSPLAALVRRAGRCLLGFRSVGACLEALIRWHKVACLIRGSRLPQDWYEELARAPGSDGPHPAWRAALGLMAAANYDARRETEEGSRARTAGLILDAWAAGVYVSAWDALDLSGAPPPRLLYDYPVCTLSQEGHRRGLNPVMATAMARLVAEDGRRAPYYTFHYHQAQRLTYLVESGWQGCPLNGDEGRPGCDAPGAPPCDAAVGACGELRRFLRAAYDGAAAGAGRFGFADLNLGRPEADRASLAVRELRLRTEDAFALMTGLDLGPGSVTGRESPARGGLPAVRPDAQGHPDYMAWVCAVAETGHAVCEPAPRPPGGGAQEPSYYPIPLRDYFPLPLLRRCLEVAHSYSAEVARTIPGGTPVPALPRVAFEYRGQLDPGFRKSFEVRVPALATLRDPVQRAVIERYLAGTATNLGICVGYDTVIPGPSHGQAGEWAAALVDSGKGLLERQDCGFELLIRYIETFMRAHDVQLSDRYRLPPRYREELRRFREAGWDPSPRAGKYALGVDIGATSIKAQLYAACGDGRYTPVSGSRLHRVPTAKSTGDDADQYADMAEFARRVAEAARAAVQAAGCTTSDLDVVGICWPGPIREQKIAGASGILGRFAEQTCSNMVRRTPVERIRRLHLIEDLRTALNLGPETTVTLCNDGTAEAVGRLTAGRRGPGGRPLRDYTEHTWAVLKLGTGIAGCILENGEPREGLAEFGKLLVNTFTRRHALRQKGAYGPGDRMPDGLATDFASGRMLEAVFRDLRPRAVGIHSHELQIIGDHLLGSDPGQPPAGPGRLDAVRRLVCRIGLAAVHSRQRGRGPGQEHLDVVLGRETLEALLGLPDAAPPRQPLDGSTADREAFRRDCRDPASARLLAEHFGADFVYHLVRRCESAGCRRLGKILEAAGLPVGEDAGPASELAGDAALDAAERRLAAALGARAVRFWEELLDRAGSVLADVIMTVREYHKFDGVILCGPPICGGIDLRGRLPPATRRLLRSIGKHLARKYFVRFAEYRRYVEESGLDRRGCPDRKDRVRRQSYTTIYHNFNIDGEDNEGDLGGIGSLNHALVFARAWRRQSPPQ